MRRRPYEVFRSILGSSPTAVDMFVGFVSRLQAVLHRHQSMVMFVAAMVMSWSLILEDQINAAGLMWWTQFGRYQFFTWAVVLSVGPYIFGRGKGGDGSMSATAASA